jgi:predicted ATPase/DNA-binding winged helix-turn-helix (wHTH) protein
MLDNTHTSGPAVFVFGPFEFHPTQRVLRRAGKRLRIGSRAAEVLLALLECAGNLVKKRALIARVWPGIWVEEGTLRVHIAALRKLLADGQNGSQYIENVTGIGYRFTALVTRPEKVTDGDASSGVTTVERASLPVLLTRPIGHAQTEFGLRCRLSSDRFVTIVGPGGVGKTTIALATANRLQPSYAHGVCFIDLGSITDGARIAAVLASTLGISVPAHNPMPQITEFLDDKRMLILLDNCEHVVHDAALVAEQLLSESKVHVLATSREALRARGEHVLRLEPLALPPMGLPMTAAQALGFSAIELFVDRTMASLNTFRFGDDDVATITCICRRLDGLPLAIELAAAHVEQFGLRGLAARLGGGSSLLSSRRRTATLRHQSLRATLDWSYNLLSRVEQLALHRLALFPGTFDIESASEVIVDDAVSAAAVVDVITSLVAMSLVTSHANGETIRYQLLYMVRAYALEKLESTGEYAAFRRRLRPLPRLPLPGMAAQINCSKTAAGTT